ncbi:MAG: hypothetical protein HYS41_04450 [Candidatus Omnitrophica bacterium]|nr:hypothetical protein [Candidatus Omnitrophota bacterium]
MTFLFLTTALAVEVSPTRLEQAISADQPTLGTLEISNPSSRAARVQIQTGPYRYLEPKFRLPSAEDWFQFEPAAFSLAPGASLTVSYTITPAANVRDDAAAEYLAAILVDQLPEEPNVIARSNSDEAISQASPQNVGGQAKVTFVPRFAVPVYLTLPEREKKELELAGLTVRVGESPDLLRFGVALKNTGTVHLRPAGSLVILSEAGTAVESRTLGRSLPILPGATLELPALVPMPGSAGRYRAAVTVQADEALLLQKEIGFEVTPEGAVK